mgnify:CR=1 FL=1
MADHGSIRANRRTVWRDGYEPGGLDRAGDTSPRARQKGSVFLVGFRTVLPSLRTFSAKYLLKSGPMMPMVMQIVFKVRPWSLGIMADEEKRVQKLATRPPWRFSSLWMMLRDS